jgi:hypothetical protein
VLERIHPDYRHMLTSELEPMLDALDATASGPDHSCVLCGRTEKKMQVCSRSTHEGSMFWYTVHLCPQCIGGEFKDIDPNDARYQAVVDRAIGKKYGVPV